MTTTEGLEAADDVALADRLREGRKRVVQELKKQIVGQDAVVDQVLLSLFVGGNSLIVGVPGLAKTLLIQTIAKVLDLKFSRIQFTPDLMPSDITGTDLVQEDLHQLLFNGVRCFLRAIGARLNHVVVRVIVSINTLLTLLIVVHSNHFSLLFKELIVFL